MFGVDLNMRQVALAILADGQRILLGKRASTNQVCPNCWDVIGGHAESGESIVEALRREVHEELGITIRAFVSLGTMIEQRPAFGGPAEFHIYLVTRWDGQIAMLGDEHTELHWFAAQEACDLKDLAESGYQPFIRDACRAKEACVSEGSPVTSGRLDRKNIDYCISPSVEDSELNRLFASAWPGHADRAFAPVLARSLVYVCAYENERLVGFVNVAWDGGEHAFLLDTTVAPDCRHQGVGTELIRRAAKAAAEAGIEWLHVDYEERLEAFYRKCGFRPTKAGLMRLSNSQFESGSD